MDSNPPHHLLSDALTEHPEEQSKLANFLGYYRKASAVLTCTGNLQTAFAPEYDKPETK